ncbi:MAG: Calx-beta domain-containing protein, partial [Limisphaerales bacterium]
TNKNIAVLVHGDVLNEGNELFYVTLSLPVNATLSRSQATVTILDDDHMPLVFIDDSSLLEGNLGTNPPMPFTIRLSAPSGRTTSVTYSTSSGTASQNVDYTHVSQSISFMAGETNKTVFVTVIGDNLLENNETFNVNLSGAQNLSYGDSSAIGTIIDDDAVLVPGDRLSFATVPSPQLTNAAIPLTIAALDSQNNVKSNFSGYMTISGFDFLPGFRTNLFADVPHDASANFGNFTLGYSFTPGTNLLLTHFRHYSGSKVSLWTDTGVLLASQSVSGPTGTWTETELPTPVQLSAGTRYRIATLTGGGTYYWRTNGETSFIHGTINQSYDGPGDTFPTNSNTIRWFMVDLGYQVGTTAQLSVSPSSVMLTNGMWTGGIFVQQAASNMFVLAQSGLVSGLSNPFSVGTNCPAPIAPFAPFPLNNSTGVVLNPTLTWSPAGTNDCPVTYDVYIGNSGPFLNLVATGLTQAQFNVGNLDFSTRYYWQIVANRSGAQVAGPLWSFTTRSAPVLDHFSWSPIASGQSVGTPIAVSITARDVFNTPITNFSGPVTLSARGDGGWTTNTILGSMIHTTTSSGTHTLGYRFTPSTNLTVTHLRHYMGSKVSIWTDTGALLTSQFISGTLGTWSETPLSSPIVLTSGIPYRIGAYVSNSTYYYSSPLKTNFPNGTINSGFTASGDAFPTSSSTINWFVDLKYSVDSAVNIPITPTTSGFFSNGVWAGSIIVTQPATNVVFRADASGRHGISGPFTVSLSNDVSVAMLTTPQTIFLNHQMTNLITVHNSGPSSATSVRVTNTFPASALFGSAATPQGSYSVSNNQVVFNVGTVAPGADLSLQVVTTPTL